MTDPCIYHSRLGSFPDSPSCLLSRPPSSRLTRRSSAFTPESVLGFSFLVLLVIDEHDCLQGKLAFAVQSVPTDSIEKLAVGSGYVHVHVCVLLAWLD